MTRLLILTDRLLVFLFWALVVVVVGMLASWAGAEEPPVAWSDDPPVVVVDDPPVVPPALERARLSDGLLYERGADNIWRLVPNQPKRALPTTAPAPAVPGVAAHPTFPPERASSGYHSGHSCPGCGRAQFTVAGFNRDGTHTHICQACGTGWRH